MHKVKLTKLQSWSKIFGNFLEKCTFSIPVFFFLKCKRAKIVIVPESADVPPVGAAMFVDFGLRTKILNLSH